MNAVEFANKLLSDPVAEDMNLFQAQAQPEPDRAAHTQHGRRVVDPKVKVLANRIALQVFSVPSLQAFLADYSIEPTGKPDDSVRIQLDFLKLPKEIIPELEKLLSVDHYKNHRLVKYIKNGQARTGLEIEVTPKELPGTAYDYSS